MEDPRFLLEYVADRTRYTARRVAVAILIAQMSLSEEYSGGIDDLEELVRESDSLECRTKRQIAISKTEYNAFHISPQVGSIYGTNR